MPSMKEKKANIKLGFGRLKPEFFCYVFDRRSILYINEEKALRFCLLNGEYLSKIEKKCIMADFIDLKMTVLVDFRPPKYRYLQMC